MNKIKFEISVHPTSRSIYYRQVWPFTVNYSTLIEDRLIVKGGRDRLYQKLEFIRQINR